MSHFAISVFTHRRDAKSNLKPLGECVGLSAKVAVLSRSFFVVNLIVISQNSGLRDFSNANCIIKTYYFKNFIKFGLIPQNKYLPEKRSFEV